MKKNIYVIPLTSVQIFAVTHVLMSSGEGPSTASGNVNNTPEEGIIGG